jgi:hypothetical protein
MDSRSAREEGRNLSGAIVVIASVIAGLSFAGTIAAYAGRGFDFTDEGYYLNVIAHPSDYRSTTTAGLFQYVWHPIFELSGGSIVALRVVNVAVAAAVTFALAWTLTSPRVATLIMRDADSSAMSMPIRLMLSVSAATSSLMVFERWLLTPGYNSLAFQAIAWTMWCCVVVMSRAGGWAHDLGLLGVALGGWLCLLAKPTSAVLLAFVVLLLLWCGSRISLRSAGILLSGLMAFVVLSLAAMRMSPYGLVDYYRASFDLNRAMGGHDFRDLLKPDHLELRESLTMGLFYGGVLAIVACVAAYRWLPRWAARSLPAVSAVAMAVVTGAVLLKRDDLARRTDASFEIVYWLAFPVAILIVLMLVAGRLRRLISGPGLALFAVFMVLPIVATFGTNNNSWHAYSRTAAFWVLAAIVLAVAMGRRHHHAFTPLFGIAVVFTVATIGMSIVFPYRQGSLLTAGTVTTVGYDDLRLTAGDAQRIEQTRLILGGGVRIRGVVDLTGESPGLIFATGERALGQGWILGAYKGSDAVAETALRDARCSDLKHAAVFVAPQGDRRIDAGVLSTVGLDLGRDFTLGGTVGTGDDAIEIFLPRATIGELTDCRE